MSLRKGSDLTADEVYVRVLSATITPSAVVVYGITLDSTGKKVRSGQMDIKPSLSPAGLTALADLYAEVKTAVQTELDLAGPP